MFFTLELLSRHVNSLIGTALINPSISICLCARMSKVVLSHSSYASYEPLPVINC
jgi:hypothetical protein